MIQPYKVRVRFAPSPTGFLHIGGVRTALFNWLYARHFHGKFLLRIEDTDLERSKEQFTKDILSSMKWLGLSWDEEILYQGQQQDYYRQKAEALVLAGHAYRCYCSEAQVEEMRDVAMKQGKKPQYDRRCRERTEGSSEEASFVIRAKIPLNGFVEFKDLIRGPIRVENSEIDDFVLIRSQGAPTYNLSVVVDDVLTEMTHVIRGDDHINNTPKQIHLYRFFNFSVPEFAHLPMILGADKKKLSKRHGAVSAHAYRSEGYLPEALLNFLARIGWSHGDQEFFSIEEMIRLFSFDSIQKSSGVFNSEKLLWLNGEHIRQTSPARLATIVLEDFGDFFRPPSMRERVNSSLGIKLISFIQPKVKLVKEIAEQLIPLCTPGAVEVDASELKIQNSISMKASVQAATLFLTDALSKKIAILSPVHRSGNDEAWGTSPSLFDAGWAAHEIDAYLRQVSDQFGIKLGDLAQPIRLTLTGRMVSAGLFELLSVLPWDVIEPRLRRVKAL